MFTTVRPKQVFDFARSRRIDPRFTFSRASAGTYFDKDGVLRTAVANEARFDHDPATGQPLGILIEEPRTNLLEHNTELQNAYWTRINAGLDINATTAPDGTTSADKLEGTTTSGTHYIQRGSVGGDGNVTQTISVFVKAAELSACRINVYAAVTGNNFFAAFDLTTASVSISGNAGNGSIEDAGVEDAGDGWYRIWVTGQADTTGANSFHITRLLLLNPSINWEGTNNTDGLYVWGFQQEVGEFKTSFIKTAEGAATRANDSLTMDGPYASNWFNPSEGTFMIRARLPKVKSAQYPCLAAFRRAATEGSDNTIEFFAAAGALVYLVRVENVTQTSQTYVAAAGSKFAAIATYKQNDFTRSVNSEGPWSDTSGSVPTGLNRLRIGSNGLNHFLNGHLDSLLYWDERLPNLSLKALS